MRGIDLTELMGELVLDSGTWFWLLDDDTGFSDKEKHPWVFPTGFDPNGRTALAHALPRSSREPFNSERPGVDFLVHAAHGSHDGTQCALDRKGWIKAKSQPVAKDSINRGQYICVEHSQRVLGQIQEFEMGYWP